MARSIRCRRICFEPQYDSFSPCRAGSTEQVRLTVDEFEAVRLIDYEKRTHEQCARQMGISRTTITEMYERARTKIADCLVGGKTLYISGGNYVLCDGSAQGYCGKKCRRAEITAEIAGERKDDRIMKIAVTYENGNVFQHFGHTEQFKVYDIKDGRVADTQLAEAGIRLYGGVSGNADEAVELLLAGKLAFNPDVHCDHHGHHGNGHCGEDKHGCTGNGRF